MATLLKQLEFIFGSVDRHSKIRFDNHSISLDITNAHNQDLVCSIAAKIGIATTVMGKTVSCHVATPLKKDKQIPQTKLQKSLHRLLDGEGDIMGLRELMSFLVYGSKYSGSCVSYKLSAMERSYIKLSGWDLKFDGLNQVNCYITRGTKQSPDLVLSNPLLEEFMVLLRESHPLIFQNRTGKSYMLCGYGSNYYRTELTKEDSRSIVRGGEGHRGKTLSDLVQFFANNIITFPNGEQITIDKSQYSDSCSAPKWDKPIEFKITPPSIGSRWQILMSNIRVGSAIPILHERGLLQEYLNVGDCVCKPIPVTLEHSDLQLIRDALSSYMEGGVYQGFKHAIVGDTLQVWLTKSPHNTYKYTQSKLRKTRKAFETAVTELTSEIYTYYENKINLK